MSKNCNENIYSNKTIDIKLESPSGSLIKVKAKENNKARKLLEAYCKMKQLSPSDFTLIYKGNIIKENMTLIENNIKNGDVITVAYRQTGGYYNFNSFINIK